MEIEQSEIFIQMGQLYAENSVLKKQINFLSQENKQLKAAFQLKVHPPAEIVPTEIPDLESTAAQQA